MQKTIFFILALMLISCSYSVASDANLSQATQVITPTQVVNPAQLKLPDNFPPPVFTQQILSKGGRIAIVQGLADNQDIWVSNMDSSASPVSLTDSPANDYKPAWSPDGTKIAFVSERDNNPEIYVMKADGTMQTRLTNNAVKDTLPVWSPDSNLIAFTSNRDEKSKFIR
jgi:Tol biopolymer transport system component